MLTNGQILLSLLFCTNGFVWASLEAFYLVQKNLSFSSNSIHNNSKKKGSYSLIQNNEPIIGSVDADDEQELIESKEINRETNEVYELVALTASPNPEEITTSLNQNHAVQENKIKTKRTFVEQLLFITRRLTALGALLLVVWFAENKPIFDHAIKEYHRSNFVILIVAFFVLGLVTIVKIKDGEEAERKEELECNLLLNRDQTEEWKGWMQYIFIIYHYTKAEEAYDFVRVLVSCYVWMTGFGNFSFFYMKKDYSIARVWRLMWRLNFSALFLCLTVNNSPMLYYIVPLHTVYFLVVYATMVVQHKYNRTKWFPRLKIFLLALIIFVIWDVPGVMKNMLTLFGLIPLSRDAHEFYFRTYLDHYSALFGMVFALNFPMMVNWFQKTEQQPVQKVYKRVILGSVFTLFLAWAWYIMHLPKDKLVYNSLHPYFTCIPIIAYILIRNYSALLRNRYSAAFRHFGKMTLETYLLQHHLFLAANAKKLFVLIPGHPVLNMLVVSVLFIFCSKLLFNLTMDLRDAFASEEHTDQQIWTRFKVIVFVFSSLYLVTKMLSLIDVTMSAPLMGSLVLTCSIVLALVLLFIFLIGKKHEHWISSYDRIFNISLICLVIVSSAFIAHSLFRCLFQLDEKGSKKVGYVGGSMLWGVFSVCFSLGSILLFDNYSGLLNMSLCLWSRGVKQVKFREAYSKFIAKDPTQHIQDSNRVLKMVKLVVGVSCTLASLVIFGYALHSMQLQSIVSVERSSEPVALPLTEDIIADKCSSLPPRPLSLYHANIDWTSGVDSGSNVTLCIKGGATFLDKLKPSETVTVLYGRARSDIADIGFLFTPCGTDCFCAEFQVFEAGQYILDVGVAQQSSSAKFSRYINVNQSSVVITGKQFTVVQSDSEIMRTMHKRPLFPNILQAPSNETYVLDGRYVNQKYALDSYAQQEQLSDLNSVMQQTTFRNWSNGFVDRNQVFIHNKYLLRMYSLSEARKCLAKHWDHILWFGDSNSRRLMTLLLHGEKNPCKDRSASCWIVGGRYKDIFGFHVERKVWVGLNEQTSDPEPVFKSFYSRKEEGALIRFMFINGLNSVENGSDAFTTLDRWKQFKDPSAHGVKLVVVSAGNWDGQRSSMPEWEENINKLAIVVKERFIDKGIKVVWFTPNFHTQTLFLNPYAVHKLTSIGAKVLDGFSLGIWRPDELPFPGYTGHSAWSRMEIQMQLLYNMLCNNME